MSKRRVACRSIERLLIAVSLGEAASSDVVRVDLHVGRCDRCRTMFQQYRAVDTIVDAIRQDTSPSPLLASARQSLEARLADLRARRLSYGLLRSPLGPILVASSSNGVSLVEHLPRSTVKASRLRDRIGVMATENLRAVAPLLRQLAGYLSGQRSHLEWKLDFSFVQSAFHRRVLEATAELPYGAVTSYAAIARHVGSPTAARAVGQALRHNPLPIAIPCHRVTRATGLLGGYTGKVTVKRRLLSLEGIPLRRVGGGYRIDGDSMYARAPGDETYCLPTCPSLIDVEAGQAILFASRETAEAAGLRPCITCRPDLYPLAAGQRTG